MKSRRDGMWVAKPQGKGLVPYGTKRAPSKIYYPHTVPPVLLRDVSSLFNMFPLKRPDDQPDITVVIEIVPHPVDEYDNFISVAH
jgi:hypothetical protein